MRYFTRFIKHNKDKIKRNKDKKPEYHYIYLLRVREFINTKEPIYKIGKTTQSNVKRIQSYPKGSQLHILIACKDCHVAEKELLKQFHINFKHREDIGSETFEGDCIHMIHLIYAHIMQDLRKTK